MSTGTGGPDESCEIAICGDVILNIPAAAGAKKFRVSSHVLCTTSPVFRAMLGPDSRFKEASELRSRSAENPYQISLEDDYPYALTVILMALHCRYEMVPVEPTFKDLVELAIVCDKYDCRGGVLPWVDTWTAAWKPRMLEKGYEEWLFVAWVFGMNEGFDKLSRNVILESYLDPADGSLISPGGKRFEKLAIPEAVLDFVTAQRASTIAAIMLEKDHLLPKYASTWGTKPLCKADHPSVECDALILGSIMKSVESSKPATEYHGMSILRLRHEISRFRLSFFPKFRATHSVGWGTKQVPMKGHPTRQGCCECGNDCVLQEGTHSNTCNPMPELLAFIDSIISSVSGMDLGSYDRIPSKGLKWKAADIR